MFYQLKMIFISFLLGLLVISNMNLVSANDSQLNLLELSKSLFSNFKNTTIPKSLLSSCNDYNHPHNIDIVKIETEDSDDKICRFALNPLQTAWDTADRSCPYINEAKRRNLDCISYFKNKENNNLKLSNQKESKIFNLDNKTLLKSACKKGVWNEFNEKHVLEAKNRALDCVFKVEAGEKSFFENEKNYKFKNETKPLILSTELEVERQKRIELERKLATIEKKQKKEEIIIKSDNQIPTINAFTKQDGSNAIISGRVTDNLDVAEVLVNGQVQILKSNGTFETNFYIPRIGKTIEIVAFDIKGNKASKILKLKRDNIKQASGPSFDSLNPSGKRVKSNPSALALIIGVANYEKTPANALYADKDAQQFYDYATLKLGIPERNIRELVNNKADRVEIGLAIQDWIARSTKQGKTDIYIYFAGHGLASQDGKDMFLLPYDGSPRLLKASGIRRKELFENIKQANPRSVTVFLDTCYSGATRNEEMLITGRPIVIKAKEQAIPEGFTLFSAASNEQISRPLEEAKHGMFSYFLMKGMEGDADANNDNQITARELHSYVEQNVVQQSSGSQTPELQGDKDRVLIQFN